MGVVVAARHVQLEQRVAIKFLRRGAGHESTAVERFLREARAAVALSSDHVARVLDVGTLESGEPFIVMEYLDGVDLGQVLDQKGPLPIPEAVDSVLQACEAIAEAHSLGIVHRDLKPSNLFRNNRRDGTTIVKVLDFGISKSADFNIAKSEKNLTASGLVMGSPGYMSPEQVRNARTVDVRTDVWALGVILSRARPGRVPRLRRRVVQQRLRNGTHSFRTFALRVVCLNGMTRENLLKQVHLGARLSEEIEFSDRTHRLDTAASVSALRDVVRGALGSASRDRMIENVRAAHDRAMSKTQLSTATRTLPKQVQKSVVDAFESPDVINLPEGNTAWRASNAISWVARHTEDAEMRLDLERAAGALV
jgi:serine/threonine protein kinase